MAAIAKQSMFEGMYVRALQPTGAFKERLKAKGYDADHVQVEYPMQVWTDCLDVAAAEVYPGETSERAWWLLGRRFIEGYLDTLVGKVITVSLPFLTARTFMQRVPRFVSTGLSGGQTYLDRQSERGAVLVLKGLDSRSASLMGGVIEVCFERMGLRGARLEASAKGPEHGELHVTWGP